MRLAAALIVFALALAGCSAHEVYEKAGMDPGAASAAWAQCQASALAATGAPTAGAGESALAGDRLRAVVVTPETTSGGAYTVKDYEKIKRREQLRQDCMKANGYRFVGTPAVERL